MNLRSSLRTLAFASVCALPLPAGTLTFNFTETGGNVVVTASGRLTDTTAWGALDPNDTTVASYIDPSQGGVNFGNGTSAVARLFAGISSTQSGNWMTAFVTPPVNSTFANSYGGDTLGFVRNFPFGSFTFPVVALPNTYSIGTTQTLLSSTMTFTGKNIAALGLTTGSYVFHNGTDTIQLTVGSGGGSGGGSSVPDAGPGPALALLLGGLGLRQWHSSRRSRATA
jgi:hypothetical protein